MVKTILPAMVSLSRIIIHMPEPASEDSVLYHIECLVSHLADFFIHRAEGIQYAIKKSRDLSKSSDRSLQNKSVPQYLTYYLMVTSFLRKECIAAPR